MMRDGGYGFSSSKNEPFLLQEILFFRRVAFLGLSTLNIAGEHNFWQHSLHPRRKNAKLLARWQGSTFH